MKEVKELRASVTRDEDETDRTTSSALETFLLTYEDMMHQQQTELAATLCHLQPLFELLMSSSNTCLVDLPGHKASFLLEFTTGQLKQAMKDINEDDCFTYLSHDQQLNFTLKLLTSTETDEERTLSWAEIVMCYRQCVLGLQTLGLVSEPEILRTRIRLRTREILAHFKNDPKEHHAKTDVNETDKTRTKPRYHTLFAIVSLIALACGTLFFTESPSQRIPPNLCLHKRRKFGNSSIESLIIPGPKIPPFAQGLINRSTPGLPTVAIEVLQVQDSEVELQSQLEQNFTSPNSLDEFELQVEKSIVERIPNLPIKVQAVAVAGGSTIAASALGPLALSMVPAAIPTIIPLGSAAILSFSIGHGFHGALSWCITRLRGNGSR